MGKRRRCGKPLGLANLREGVAAIRDLKDRLGQSWREGGRRSNHRLDSWLARLKKPVFLNVRHCIGSTYLVCGIPVKTLSNPSLFERLPAQSGGSIPGNSKGKRLSWEENLEAPPGFEPGMEVLQAGPGCLYC